MKSFVKADSKETLIKKALAARDKAYAPYSRFAVGAALLCANGNIYTGCNIENSAFTPTVCAERVAFYKAVSEGVVDFTAIAIVGGREGENVSKMISPCGVCRQVMSEFCSPENFEIYLYDGIKISAYKLVELLPLGFSKDSL